MLGPPTSRGFDQVFKLHLITLVDNALIWD